VADVAQLVESQIVILVVAGSSPVVRPTEFSKKAPFGAFSLCASMVYLLLRADLADSAARFDILTASAAAIAARLVASAASAEAKIEDSSA
jgi:hypothetical protein